MFDKNKQRWALVGATLALVLTACGAPAAQQAAPAAEAPSADQTGEITVYTVPGAPQTVLERMQKDFNAKYPKVNIKINSYFI